VKSYWPGKNAFLSEEKDATPALIIFKVLSYLFFRRETANLSIKKDYILTPIDNCNCAVSYAF